MGYKTEINYILKSSIDNELKNLNQGDVFEIVKSGFRTYVLGSPIFFADSQWNILGMCTIFESNVSTNKTILKSKVLLLLNEKERLVISELIQKAELLNINI